MANNPALLKMPLATDGDKATIPETSGATTGEFSQQYGFQQINALPLQAGGIAPRREDFNGAFNLLSGIIFFAQKGWRFTYDAGQEYYAGCVVRDSSNGKSYLCIADVSANAGLPSADVAGAHWQELPDLTSFFRQPSTAYVYNDARLAYGLKQPFFLECTTGGTSDDDEIVLPATPTAGTTITDGTVTWTIRKFASTDDMPVIPDAMPKGIILPYAGQGTPDGYLFCDGSPVSRETYADLFSVIGTKYGAGNGATTFNLPNIIDKFVQGSSTAGTVKNAGLPNITGTTTIFQHVLYSAGTGAISTPDTTSGGLTAGGGAGRRLNLSFSASNSNSIYGSSSTVQPPALTQRWVIKY